jgi:hypothetical protein
MTTVRKFVPRARKNGELLKLHEAALELRISYPTIKQWIYSGRSRALQLLEDTTGFLRARWTVFCTGRGRRPSRNEPW